jgi:hypothetical protein
VLVVTVSAVIRAAVTVGLVLYLAVVVTGELVGLNT